MVPQLIKDILLILGIVPVALAVYLLFERKRLRRLMNEQALHLKEIELHYLIKSSTELGSGMKIPNIYSKEGAYKIEGLEAEISYYKKLLGKKDS